LEHGDGRGRERGMEAGRGGGGDGDGDRATALQDLVGTLSQTGFLFLWAQTIKDTNSSRAPATSWLL
jgi:hypothetical protein